MIGRQVADPGHAGKGRPAIWRKWHRLPMKWPRATQMALSTPAAFVSLHSAACRCSAASNLLRHFLRLHGLRMPDARLSREILRQQARRRSSRCRTSLIDDWRLQVTRGRLWLVPRSAASVDCRWCGQPSAVVRRLCALHGDRRRRAVAACEPAGRCRTAPSARARCCGRT